jgi:hypothetical protein
MAPVTVTMAVRGTASMAGMRLLITTGPPPAYGYGYAPAYYGGYTTSYAPAYYGPRYRRIIRPACAYGGPRYYYRGYRW